MKEIDFFKNIIVLINCVADIAFMKCYSRHHEQKIDICACVCQHASLTVNVFLVPLQALYDAGVGFKAALPQLVQIIHHIVVRLQTQTNALLITWHSQQMQLSID